MSETEEIYGVEFTRKDDAVEFALRVIPGSNASEIVGAHDGALKIRVQAAPEKGKANKAVIQLLSKSLGASVKSVEMISGETSQRKRVRVFGLSAKEVADKLFPSSQR